MAFGGVTSGQGTFDGPEWGGRARDAVAAALQQMREDLPRPGLKVFVFCVFFLQVLGFRGLGFYNQDHYEIACMAHGLGLRGLSFKCSGLKASKAQGRGVRWVWLRVCELLGFFRI